MELEKAITKEDSDLLKSLSFNDLDELKTPRQIWLKDKEGCFSASEFFRLLTEEEKEGLPKGAYTYIVEKVLEIVTNKETLELYAKQIVHGKEYEKEAMTEFEKLTGKHVDYFGENQKFIKISEYVGCTPDGLIGNDEGAETKCPNSETHYKYLMYLRAENIKQMYPQAYWQMQGCMYITKRKGWYFISYDPRFKDPKKRLHIVYVERNQADISKLEKRLFLATKEIKQQLKTFNEL